MQCRTCKGTWQTMPGEEMDHDCPRCGPLGPSRTEVETAMGYHVRENLEEIETLMSDAKRFASEISQHWPKAEKEFAHHLDQAMKIIDAWRQSVFTG